MMYFFTGNYNGEHFIGVRAPKPEQQYLAGLLVDSMSDRNGPKIPELNQHNALIRRLSGEVLPLMVETKLDGVKQATVKYVPDLADEDLTPYFESQELEKAFEAAKTQAVAEQAPEPESSIELSAA
ncbi:MAG TPA: hypothetical protein VN031_03675 [Candidatus Microsaccharimonas sp.]|nr:hypothetical protein [Candidatus Microsaccharimonas sp.]